MLEKFKNICNLILDEKANSIYLLGAIGLFFIFSANIRGPPIPNLVKDWRFKK